MQGFAGSEGIRKNDANTTSDVKEKMQKLTIKRNYWGINWPMEIEKLKKDTGRMNSHAHR